MDRKAREKALAANELSPIRTLVALSALSDTELEGLEKHVIAKKTENETRAAADKKAADDKAAADKKTADEAAARAAAAPAGQPAQMSEEDWLKTAPASIRSLVDSAKATEAAQRTRLITALKSAQKEYTEDEMKTMDVKTLTRIARLANLSMDETVDYSGMGLPRVVADASTDVYRNPPNGYRMALDARAAAKGQVN